MVFLTDGHRHNFDTKKSVEYTFQNSPGERLQTILLSEYNVTVRSQGRESVFPYSSIIEVQLQRGHGFYKTLLITNGGQSITVTNKSYSTERTVENNSRAYSTFIRILHFHLKDKSRAVFTSGERASKVGMWVIAALVISFAISFVADYLGWGLVNPYLQSAVLAVMMGILILAIYMGKWPKRYKPTDIPLEFLP